MSTAAAAAAEQTETAGHVSAPTAGRAGTRARRFPPQARGVTRRFSGCGGCCLRLPENRRRQERRRGGEMLACGVCGVSVSAASAHERMCHLGRARVVMAVRRRARRPLSLVMNWAGIRRLRFCRLPPETRFSDAQTRTRGGTCVASSAGTCVASRGVTEIRAPLAALQEGGLHLFILSSSLHPLSAACSLPRAARR